MLHEVARFAPAEPAAAAVDGAAGDGAQPAPAAPEALAAVLARGGFTTARLAAWVRDDLRIAAYLDQRFASAGVPAEAEVAAYAEAHGAELERAGVPPPTRDADAAAERARARWLADAPTTRARSADWLVGPAARRTEVRRVPPTAGLRG